MIEIKNLTFAYNRDVVLDNISWSSGEGQLIAVLGPNGAGKSTLFKCILGFLKNYSGEILIDGNDVKKLSRREMAKLAAYIPQAEIPVFNYKVMESVLMGTTGAINVFQSPGEEQIKIAEEAVSSLGIEHLAERGINEISGGERQLALLARAIAQQAKIFIMDEPTANLDYGNQQHVLNHVQEMTKQGYTVLLSTHNPEHALQYASHVLAIKNHRILAYGPAESIMNEKLIEEIYGLKVTVIDVEIDGRTVRSCIPSTVVRK